MGDSRPLNPAFLRYFTPNAVTGRRVPLFGLKSVEGVPADDFSVERALLNRVHTRRQQKSVNWRARLTGLEE